MNGAGMDPMAPQGPVRPTAAFMVKHPSSWLALGFGSGLSPWAPGTVGTLWAWLSFGVINPWLSDAAWGAVLALGLVVGVAACTRCAQALRIADPSAIVWDEILAFWLILWLLSPASWVTQGVAFALFRYFDAAKPGPVGWADRCFKGTPGEPIAWRQGFGIMFDDGVAALCTLMVMAIARAALGW